MKRLRRGIVGIVMMVFLGIQYAWSYFKVALEAAFPAWTQVQITMNFSIVISCFSIGSFIAGHLMKRVSKQTQVRVAAVLLLVGFLGVSFISPDAWAIYKLYFFYGILVGNGIGLAYNAIVSAVPRWFPDKPGLISGVLLMGMGVGALLIGNTANLLIPAVGLPSVFRIIAVALFIVLFFGAPAIRMPSESEIEAAEKTVPVNAWQGKSFTPKEMVRRPSFWLYFAWNILTTSAGMVVINFASSISVYFGMAAVVGLLVSLFNGVGRVLLGMSIDRFGWKKALYLNNGIIVVAGLVLCAGNAGSAGIVVLTGILMLGISYGGGAALSVSLPRQLYGNEFFSQNAAISNFSLIPASLLGPVLAAWLQDSFIGYSATFVMVVILGAAAMIVNFFICKP